MFEYKLELFPKYIFCYDKKQLKIYSLYKYKFLKKYYSTKFKYWRYKLVTRFGHSLQLNESQIKSRLENAKKRIC